ncbi:hypothetical protein [Bifidobacterium biavatii]|uniref:Putative membrane spanning protein n=1 Tax=Bifidobacterium biavatii DSM 23969 TaxID=1437608 RepID=A0A087A1K0_9BIFI|nr:hypothetical protein [Bifidobacterium biavatii]KFI52650.1 putative membrane spanning protein [Bifidobacterium biavatii DSM 23969]
MTGPADCNRPHDDDSSRGDNPLAERRAWWREPHFLEKNTIFGCALIVLELIVLPPDSPMQMLLALAWLGLVSAIPFMRGVPYAIALQAVVAGCSLLPGQGWWTSGGTAIMTAFLAVGYLLPRWGAVAAVLGYATLDAVGFSFAGTNSIGGRVIRGAIGAINDIVADDAATGGAEARRQAVAVALPQYSIIVLVFTFALDLMIVGFLVTFGAVFRRTAEANERAARSERLLRRITREQELAHMIHDSVANDMSTIAMLAWRAKAAVAAQTPMTSELRAGTTDDSAESPNPSNVSGVADVPTVSGIADAEDLDTMLDTIYERSHHALDRVHEVIDVLNGERDLMTKSDPSKVMTAYGASAESPFGVQLEKYVEDQDRTMTMLGIRGVSQVRCTGSQTVSPAVRRVTMNLLEEIYANLVRHCTMRADAAYHLFVAIDDRHIRINEVNTLADESDSLTHGHRHGSGLGLHRASIEALGGMLHASAQDGAWTLSAEIPLAVS